MDSTPHYPKDYCVKVSLSQAFEEQREPRKWGRLGLLIALQPFDWKFGIDREYERQVSLDVGPLRFTVA